MSISPSVQTSVTHLIWRLDQAKWNYYGICKTTKYSIGFNFIYICILHLRFTTVKPALFKHGIQSKHKSRQIKCVTDVWTDGLIDMCIPVYQLHLKRRGYSIFFYFPRSLLWQGARMAHWLRSLDLTTHTSLSPLRPGFAPGFVNLQQLWMPSGPSISRTRECCWRPSGADYQ
jgi:hypothetical protein